MIGRRRFSRRRDALVTTAIADARNASATSGGRDPEDRHAEAWALAAAAATAEGLLECLNAREDHVPARADAVVELALDIGRSLGLDGRMLANLEWAARLHDIGKLGISASILNKPGELTRAEWAEMRQHAEIGERIIASVPEIAHLARIVRAGHERWDGTGYPDRLLGHEIPLASRIVFVSDAYHAMLSPAPHRHAPLSAAEARTELDRHAGTQFCPTVVKGALSLLTDSARST